MSGLIYRWRREAGQDGGRAFPGNGLPREEELARLRTAFGRGSREERDILQKSA